MVSALRAANFDVIDIKEQSPGIKDSEVLSAAAGVGAILLTNDKDFGELVFRERAISNGVILLRFEIAPVAEKIERLLNVLAEHGDELTGAFTVISSAALRIRKDLQL